MEIIPILQCMHLVHRLFFSFAKVTNTPKVTDFLNKVSIAILVYSVVLFTDIFYSVLFGTNYIKQCIILNI